MSILNSSEQNLSQFINNLSFNDNFTSLLAKHHEGIEKLTIINHHCVKIKNSLIIIEINEFTSDLICVAKLYHEISLNNDKIKEIINENGQILNTDHIKELAKNLNEFYKLSIFYKKSYFLRRMFNFESLKFSNDMEFLFQKIFYDEKLSLNENILKTISSFETQKSSFVSFLNILYKDGEEGEEFLKESFESVYLKYRNIASSTEKIIEKINNEKLNEINEIIQNNKIYINGILENYPSILYIPILEIIKELEKNKLPI